MSEVYDTQWKFQREFKQILIANTQCTKILQCQMMMHFEIISYAIQWMLQLALKRFLNSLLQNLWACTQRWNPCAYRYMNYNRIQCALQCEIQCSISSALFDCGDGYVVKSIHRLKWRKGDGSKGFDSDHIIIGSRNLSELLCGLFYMMITHARICTWWSAAIFHSTCIYKFLKTTEPPYMSYSDSYAEFNMYKLFDY